MIIIRSIFPLLVALAVSGAVNADSKDKNQPWQQIFPPSEINYVDANGVERSLQPSCSGGPVCFTDPTTGLPNCQLTDTQFSFFVRQGKKDKLAVMFDGGGACWDSLNCVSFPSYTPLVTETTDQLGQTGGIAEFSNPENPLKEFTMVFIPYCTGDIHWGSTDTEYLDALGQFGSPGGSVTIRHRGWDNFLSVLSWLQKDKWSRQSRKNVKVKKLKSMDELVVMGSSAGGYGALFGFPYLRDTQKEGGARLLIDGASGVVTDDFMDQALGVIGSEALSNWNVRDNLPNWIPGYVDYINHGADLFAIGLITATANYYAEDAIGQYTTAWDITQIGFLNLMQNINNPAIWRQPSAATICEWHGRMNAYANAQTSSANFRYYIAAGSSHTVLANPNDNNLFYTQDTAGQPFVEWFDAMLEWESNDDEGDEDDDHPPWVNARCVDCQPLFDPALCGF